MTGQISKSVCFTGHRIIKKDFNRDDLKKVVEELIEGGYNRFLCGMALGFDMLAFEVVKDIKNEYEGISIIACVPCRDQAKRYPRAEKNRYERLLKSADEVIVLKEEYDEYCMKERDRYMVDNSSVCVSYLYKSTGGAYYTTRYAVEKDREIIYVK